MDDFRSILLGVSVDSKPLLLLDLLKVFPRLELLYCFFIRIMRWNFSDFTRSSLPGLLSSSLLSIFLALALASLVLVLVLS